AAEQLEVPSQLLDAVDVAAAFHLDRDRATRSVGDEQVDRPNRRHVLTADESRALAEPLDLLREESLQVGLDAVLDEPGIVPELVRAVVEHLIDRDDEEVGRLDLADAPD